MTPRNPVLGLVLRLTPLAAIALVASGCGGSSSASSDASTGASTGASSSPSVALASGVSLTKAGSKLSFGASAVVAFAPNEKKSTGLSLTVTKVVKGRISDLAAYQLDAATQASVPYYVTVTVKNVGTGDVGRSAIPLWGLSSDDTLIGSSGFTNSFATCPSRPLPTTFAAGADLTTCVLYLVPKGGTLTGVSYRPLMSAAPIVWTGPIAAAPVAKTAGSAKKPSTKG